MSARAYTSADWVDPRSEARERRYQAAQPSLGLVSGNRTASFSPRIEPAIMALLPMRSNEWMKLARRVAPEDVQIWVPLTWTRRILEFVSASEHWACLWPCGAIETFAPDDRRKRVVIMQPHEAFAVHQAHPLVDISLHEKTLTLRFRRPSETRGTINAEPALRRACHLPPRARQAGEAT
ncbi:RNA polymerase alpha/RpoL/Rpb11 family protein [Asaia spathodeae]|uniref:Uncharacterized protein n=1 Tax=Asaia spathodeae TaxID=657016 RepID=A0ABX2P9D2_9PROT|nr:hypothetical protein [Asaia spathodeae]GBR20982.1 hypothetical protein AA105894_2685 [Asaia spathodeae NBRC 105894]